MSRTTPPSADALAVIDLAPDARIGALTRRVAAIVTDGVLAAVHQHDTRIKGAHLRIFATLADGPARIVDISAQLGTTKQTVAPSVDELVTWGYLERATDPRDARAKLVTPTGAGQMLGGVALAAAEGFEEEWRTVLGPQRLEECRAALWAIIDAHT